MYETRYDAVGAQAAKVALESHYPKTIIFTAHIKRHANRLARSDDDIPHRVTGAATARRQRGRLADPVLFVVEEHAIYLRSTSAVAVAMKLRTVRLHTLGGGGFRVVRKGLGVIWF